MPSTLELCEKYWGTKDIYDILNLTKESSANDVKKAYYRLSLLVHPDRVKSDEKERATEKFKVLSKLYTILTDDNKRALYNEKGIIDDDDDNLASWLDIWKTIFKPITDEDINKYEKEYVGSDLEKQDIKKAYLNGKGCINVMMELVPFMAVEDEPRIHEIIKELIAAGDVPEFKQFTEEPHTKCSRRHRKYAKESREAKQIKKNMEAKSTGSPSLEQLILQRQTNRGQDFNSFVDKLAEKYGNIDEDIDDSEEYVPPKRKATAKKANSTRKTSSKK